MSHVAKMCAADFPFAVQLASTIGWGMAVEDFEFAVALEPDGCFVAFYGSERVGIVTCVSFGSVGWFGNLVVTESYRRRGAGVLLLKHAVAYLRGRGAETIGLYAYPRLVGFYRRFGFEPEADFMVFQGKAAPLAVDGTVKLQKAKKQDIHGIVAFDSQCFGTDRKKLLEPILLDKNNLCYVAADAEGIAGYCAATVIGEAAGVGPLICRRNHSSDAPVLLEAVLSKLPRRGIFTCAPTDEKALIDVLSKAGLQEKFRVTRMFLGTATAKDCTYMPESLERG